MSVLARVNFVGQGRVDLHHMLAMESFAAADLRALISAFVGSDKTYIVRGLEVVSKNGLTVGIKVSDSMVMNPLDQNGSFYIGLPDDADVSIKLPPNQTNIFVEGVFTNVTRAPVNQGVWDPLSVSGESADGEEFTASIDTQNVIQLEISVNTTGFSEGAIKLFRGATNASDVIDFRDSRELLLRLARGGANPDPLYKYGWSADRAESTPAGTGVGDAIDSPWRAKDGSGAINDKAFRSIKDWMDAVMTRFTEISGSSIWYLNSGSGGGGIDISLQTLWFDAIGHSIEPSKNASYKWAQSGGGFRLFAEGTIPLNGTTGQYHNGLIKWKMNSTELKWELGGTFVSNTPGGKRNFTSTGLRFQSPLVVDGGNIYLSLEREIPKGSGANVSWGDAGTSGFAASESVTGSINDFTGIALGDYIRKESANINQYYQVSKFWDGTNVYDNTVDSDTNKIADSSVITLELVSAVDPNGTSIVASSEPLRYFRSRYSSADVVADTVSTAGGVTHDFQSSSFYWMGRRVGPLFILRNYGTMQEGEEVPTIDCVFAQGQNTAGNPLVFQHAKEAIYDVSAGYSLKTGSGNLLTIYRKKRDNTVAYPSTGDNSGSLLQYTIAAPLSTMTVGQGLWVRLSDTTSGALASGSVTNATDDVTNVDTTTNLYEIRDAVNAPVATFDNIDIFLVARRVVINGQAALVFADGSILTGFGQMLNTNLDISGEVRLNDYNDTAIPFIANDGSKLLDEDVTNLFYNKTDEELGIVNFRIGNNYINQDTPADIALFDNLGAHTIHLGDSDSTINIPGDLIVQGTTFASNTENVQSDDKLISLGVGTATDQAFGGGIELVDNTQTAASFASTNAQIYIDLTYGSAHGYSLGDIVGVNATEGVGGITAGQIGGQYTVVTTGMIAGEAQIISPTVLRIWTVGTATSTASASADQPRTFTAPWSFRLGSSAGAYTTGGVTSWVFRVKNVATAPTITPVASYGIVPTANSTNMLSTRIPFVNDDNAGPSGVDTTLNFSANFAWNNSTNVLTVVGNIASLHNLIPGADDTYDLGENSTPLRWRMIYLGASNDSGLTVGTTKFYETSTGILRTDGVLQADDYIIAGSFAQISNTASFTGPTPLPTSTSLNVFVRGGIVYSQDASGYQRTLTNVDGNVYNEDVTVVTSPSGDNQMAVIGSTPTTVTLPTDKRRFVGNTTAISTDGSTSTVTVTVPAHGLTTGALITTYASVSVGGISAANLSVVNSAITVLTADTFTYTAGAASTSATTGYLDKLTVIGIRYYIVGSGELEVYKNGVLQTINVDYFEFGLANTMSNQIIWLKTLTGISPADIITYRVDSNGGQVIVNQNGGSSLQSAYASGATINITPGTPFTVTNSGSGKAAVFNGDIDVTGVIDPTAITFTPVTSAPFSSSFNGLYVDSGASRDLVYARDGVLAAINMTQDFLYRDGSKAMTGALDLGTHQLKNLSAATDPTDAVTYGFVTTAVSTINSSISALDLYTANFITLTNNTGSTILAGAVVAASASVAGEMVLANASSYTLAKGTVGIVSANILNGASGRVQVNGRATVLGSSYTIGQPVYLSTTSGHATSTSPTAANSVSIPLGIAVSTTEIAIVPSAGLVNSNIYEETITVTSNQSANTMFSLPTDSRSGLSKTYVVGSGQLKVYLNGVLVSPQYITESSTTAFAYTQDITATASEPAVFTIRIELSATAIITGGGGSSTLQDAYDLGATIVISSGNPLTINGPAEKLLIINGDITVTGIIDPTGITLTPQSSNPIPNGMVGLYATMAGDVIHVKDDGTPVNITAAAESSTPRVLLSTHTISGSVTKGQPLLINSSGNGTAINLSSSTALTFFGLASDNISDASLEIATHGRLTNVSINAIVGDILYVSATGGLIGTSEFTSGDAPSVGVNGYQTGMYIIRVGVVAKNISNPAQKDIIINLQLLGQLPA